MAHVVSLFCYPIKGFEGEKLDSVSLEYGKGFPGDRAVAITRSGAAAGAAPYQQLTTNSALVHFLPGKSRGAATLHERLPVPRGDLLTDPELLAEFFGVQARVVHRNDCLGHWDFDDSALSIINVRTVEVLSTLMGVTIDPMRFRGNIYIDAAPFSEFGWLGKGVDFGQSRLSIIRPIKRCRATSVNPQTGELDVNIPAQLNRHFGHMYCGVYAQVEQAGTLLPNDRISVTQAHYPERLAIAAKVPRAPALVSWPRSVEVVEIFEEAPGIRSVWLRDPLAVLGSLESFVAGQHVAVHHLAVDGTWRRYTVSGIKDDRLRITVKQGSGAGSQAIHTLETGQRLHLTGPSGPDTFRLDAPANLFLTAGIGITPTITKLEALVEAGYPHPVRVVHTVKGSDDLALWNEVTKLVGQLNQGSIALHMTQGKNGTDGAIEHRPDISALVTAAAHSGAAIHVCGPEGFQGQIQNSVIQADAADRLHMDSFATPDSPVEMRKIPECGPFQVTFSRSGISATWQPTDGTLLSFAETKGLVLPAHCRAGICQTCECAVLHGKITPLIDSCRAKSGYALMCASVPGSDISIDC
ncbi:MOSC domain-containing protein [Pseudomonas sp. WHRI 8519]|uniref:MOSC domain-containing protein n=1 Tax=Pseudomonas sp. WHRI 8519 TaxID=3162567 RepID=UPI0032ED4298